MLRFGQVLGLLLAALLAVSGMPSTAAAPAISAEEQALVLRAIERGTLLYAYDQAAWHGTDDLLKMTTGREQVGGWIVDGPADAPHLVMIDRDEREPHALYVADFRDGKLTSSRLLGPSDDHSLTPARTAMVVALRSALKALEANHTPMCKPKPFNTVVLPGEAGAPTLVYFFTPQTETNALPLAGHYLVEVSSDGKAGPVQSFTKSACMEMPLKNEKGEVPAALAMTDLLHLAPTEIQVFSSLYAHLPLYVMTAKNKRIWSVEGNRIRLIDKVN